MKGSGLTHWVLASPALGGPLHRQLKADGKVSNNREGIL